LIEATNTEGSTDKSVDGVWEVSPYVVFGLGGFTLYLAWMFMLYISPALAPENLLTTLGIEAPWVEGVRHLTRFALVGALWLTLLAGWRGSDAFCGRFGVLLMLVGSVVLNGMGLGILLLLGTVPAFSNGEGTAWMAAVAPFVTMALVGVAQGFMVLLWSSFLSTIGEHRVLLFSAICVGCAAGLTLLMSFLQPLPAVWITFLFGCLAMGCFAFIHFRQAERPRPLLVKARVSDKRFSIHIKSTISVILYSMMLGIAVCFIAASDSGLFGVVAASVAVIVASVIVGMDSTRFHRINESLLDKFHMPAIVLGIAPMFFTDRTAQVLGCAWLLCFFMVVFIINLTALAEHTRIHQLNSVRIFGFGRAGNAFGFLVGGLACYAAFYAPRSEAFSGDNAHTWVVAILLGVFAIGASFIFEDHYPVGSGSPGAIRAPERRPSAARPLPDNDLHALSTYMLTKPDNSPNMQAGIWKRRIKALSIECNLSPRETDVLFLLAKGRNAEFIQNELVVSRHTAKAHIYHIYQKTGVHSRQDLIDLLESMDVERI
jgi:DNA-binding CsgD family transcriptional regulator